MRMRLKFILIQSLFLLSYSFGQQDDEDFYKKNILTFYEVLFGAQENSVKILEDIFGSEMLLSEEELYYKICPSDNYECYPRYEAIRSPEKYPSLYFQLLKKKLDLLTFGYDHDYIRALIDEKGVLIDDGAASSIRMILNFDDMGTLYFAINRYKDEGPSISIYLQNGKPLISKLNNKESDYKFSMLGVINDPDGYTNLRSGAGTGFEVVERILETDIFDYYPTSESNWWSVTNIRTCSSGYVHKSRIQLLNLFSGSYSEEQIQQARRRHVSPIPCYN